MFVIKIFIDKIIYYTNITSWVFVNRFSLMIAAFLQTWMFSEDSLCCCCYLALASQLTYLEKGFSSGNSCVPNLFWFIAKEHPIWIHYQEYEYDRCCQTPMIQFSYFSFWISNFQKGKVPHYAVQARVSAEVRERGHLLIRLFGFLKNI